jgi:hypothetical protein
VGQRGYDPQEAQEPPPQDEQDDGPLAPETALGTPPMEALKAEKTDILRRAAVRQDGHSQGWSDWLSGRIFSKLVSHSGQTYS